MSVFTAAMIMTGMLCLTTEARMTSKSPYSRGSTDADAKKEEPRREYETKPEGAKPEGTKSAKPKKGSSRGRYRENAALVKRYLDANDWHYEMKEHPEAGTVTFRGGVGGFEGAYASFRFVLLVNDSLVQNYAMLPSSFKGRVPQVVEFITRANYGMKLGSFEFDYDDLDVRFHLTFPIEAVRADADQLAVLLHIPPRMLDKYAKGFTWILQGTRTPAEAVRACEDD